MSEENGKAGTQSEGEVKRTTSPTIADELATFIQHVDALADSLPLLLLLMIGHLGAAAQKYVKFLKTKGELIVGDGKGEWYKFQAQHIREFRRLSTKANHAKVGVQILPRSFLVALVSQYDFFLSRLFRCLFFMRPEKLNLHSAIAFEPFPAN